MTALDRPGTPTMSLLMVFYESCESGYGRTGQVARNNSVTGVGNLGI